jgi:hypothetical protein
MELTSQGKKVQILNKHKVLLILTLIVLLAGACETFGTIPIRNILEKPREYADTTVVVSGKVTQIFGLVFIKYFVLEDKTGSIAVVTDKPLPKMGSEIKVRGTLKEAFVLGDQQLLVLIEHDGGVK